MGTSVGLLIRNYLDTGNESYFEELMSTFQLLIKSYARKQRPGTDFSTI